MNGQQNAPSPRPGFGAGDFCADLQISRRNLEVLLFPPPNRYKIDFNRNRKDTGYRREIFFMKEENKLYLAHIAKDGRTQTVLEHLEGVSKRCAASAAAFGAEEQGRETGLAHDVGNALN